MTHAFALTYTYKRRHRSQFWIFQDVLSCLRLFWSLLSQISHTITYTLFFKNKNKREIPKFWYRLEVLDEGLLEKFNWDSIMKTPDQVGRKKTKTAPFPPWFWEEISAWIWYGGRDELFIRHLLLWFPLWYTYLRAYDIRNIFLYLIPSEVSTKHSRSTYTVFEKMKQWKITACIIASDEEDLVIRNIIAVQIFWKVKYRICFYPQTLDIILHA